MGKALKNRFRGRRRMCKAPSWFSDPPPLLLISSVLGRAAASCLDPPLLLPALFPPPPSLSLFLLSAFAREHQREPGSRVTRHPDMSLKLFLDVKVEDRNNNSDAMNERRGRTIGLNNSLMSFNRINRAYEIRLCISSKVIHVYLCGDTWHT